MLSILTLKAALASAPSNLMSIFVPPAAVPLLGIMLMILGVKAFL